MTMKLFKTPILLVLTLALLTALISPSHSKIVRYRQPDGTIVFKQVPDDEPVSPVIKASHNSSGDSGATGITSDSASPSASSSSATEAPVAVKASRGSSAGSSPGKGTASSATGVSGTKVPSGSTEASVQIKGASQEALSGQGAGNGLMLYMALGITGVLLLFASSGAFVIWKVQTRKAQELEEKLNESNNRLNAMATQHKVSLKDHEESLKDRMIQDIAVMTKLREIAGGEDLEAVVSGLFFVLQTVARASSVAIFAKDSQTQELFVWRFQGMDSHRARILRVSPTDICLMNLCMTRAKEVSQADSERDAAVARTSEISSQPCLFAYPLIHNGETRGCISIEALEEGRGLNDGEVLGLITTASSIAAMSLSNLGFHNLTREELLLPKGAAPIVQPQAQTDLDPYSRVISEKTFEHLLKYPDLLKNARGLKDASLLYARINNYDEIAALMDPAFLAQGMNRLYQAFQEVIFDYDGCVALLFNGTILAFWGGPVHQKNHQLQAVQAAMRMGSVLKRLISSHEGVALPELQMGIGVHSCQMVLDLLGTPRKMEYGAAGRGIAIAMELEGLTESFGADVLITEPVASAVSSDLETVEVDMVTLGGAGEGSFRSCIYRVRGFKVK